MSMLDEDEFVFPDGWRRALHPRRGGAPGPKVTLDRKAPAATAALVAEVRERWLDRVLMSPDKGPAILERIVLALKGEPDAVGAAALALAATEVHGYKQLPSFVDAWVLRFGHAFAAVAAVQLGHVTVPSGVLMQPNRYGGHHGSATVAEMLRRLRCVLAACPDEAYAEAVAALGQIREDCDQCRVAIAYAVPTELAWVAQACGDYAAQGRSADARRLDLLHRAMSTAEQVALLGEARFLEPQYTPQMDLWVTVVDGLGPAAGPLFGKVFRGYGPMKTKRAAAEFLAQIPGDAAFRLLMDHVEDGLAGPSVREASARFPRRALRLLAEAAAGQGEHAQQAAFAADLLQHHVRAHGELARAEAPNLPEDIRVLLEGALRQSAAKPEAPLESLPALLVSPPWTRPVEQRPQPVPKVVTGLEPPASTRVEWTEGETEQVGRMKRSPVPSFDYARAAAQLADAIAYGDHNIGAYGATELFLSGPVEEHRALLRQWRPEFEDSAKQWLWPILERFDVDAVPALLHAARHGGPVKAEGSLLPVLDLDVARLVADWLLRLKTGRTPAHAWLDRHGADAALLLIPDAVGTPGKPRTAAEGALRYLAAGAVPDLVELAASRYGEEAADAVRVVLGDGPAAPLPPVTAPALPKWLDPAALPPIALRGGEQVLPESAHRHLLAALALAMSASSSTSASASSRSASAVSQEPYPGFADALAAALAALDRTELAESAWQAFLAWRSMGHPAQQAWVLGALGLVGDDTTVARLVPVINAWPGESGHHRAVAGLEVLAALGTDYAVSRLNEIAQRAQFKALKEQARTKIAQIAAQRGLTGEQLADRLVPDLGLDADGGLWLDYGPRRFRVGFDENLKPFVTDAAGARRKDLPAPNAKDDAELAAAARAQFSALKKEARAVAADQIRRFEYALADQRSWTAAEFTGLLLGHPLLRHLVGRLLWVAEVDGTRTGFRAAEDLSLADVEDAPFALPSTATVRLAHPLLWPQGLTAWSEIFADYEILQPFDQFGREVHALTDEEKAGYRLVRFEGRTVPIGRILGLTKQGWRRSPAMDNGIENCVTRSIDENRYLVIDLDDGIPVGMVGEEWAAEQTLDAVYLSTRAEAHHAGYQDSGLRFADLDPLTASELLRVLTMLVE
ncbi:DUF4132 domain-containing protein [Actinospica durhamensis]|uniref:DUF4132 domain-containing protein n=1 Tax=Actinospica durhamensis TaxID=1508375 RepID=A0A941EV88_9ACTN|nr:DUF4132 domain-containing protein [Actinospica durhamensis]MBR7837901.1 DUF4132 domain-containing protein [Actinospica durhamensis]